MSDQETLRVITLADKAMDEIERLTIHNQECQSQNGLLKMEIERLQARIAELEDKLRHSDRKEIEACYRAMGKKDARIAELEKTDELCDRCGASYSKEIGYCACGGA